MSSWGSWIFGWSSPETVLEPVLVRFDQLEQKMLQQQPGSNWVAPIKAAKEKLLEEEVEKWPRAQKHSFIDAGVKFGDSLLKNVPLMASENKWERAQGIIGLCGSSLSLCGTMSTTCASLGGFSLFVSGFMGLMAKDGVCALSRQIARGFIELSHEIRRLDARLREAISDAAFMVLSELTQAGAQGCLRQIEAFMIVLKDAQEITDADAAGIRDCGVATLGQLHHMIGTFKANDSKGHQHARVTVKLILLYVQLDIARTAMLQTLHFRRPDSSVEGLLTQSRVHACELLEFLGIQTTGNSHEPVCANAFLYFYTLEAEMKQAMKMYREKVGCTSPMTLHPLCYFQLADEKTFYLQSNCWKVVDTAAARRNYTCLFLIVGDELLYPVSFQNVVDYQFTLSPASDEPRVLTYSEDPECMIRCSHHEKLQYPKIYSLYKATDQLSEFRLRFHMVPVCGEIWFEDYCYTYKNPTKSSGISFHGAADSYSPRSY